MEVHISDLNLLLDAFTEQKRQDEKNEEESQITKQKNTEECSYCDNTELNVIDGAMVCIKCGTINHNIIDYSAEWRFYGSEDSKFSDPTRCGMPTNELLPQSSLGSTISFKEKKVIKCAVLERIINIMLCRIKNVVYTMFLNLLKYKH